MIKFIRKYKNITIITLVIIILCLTGFIWNTILCKSSINKNQPLGTLVDVYDTKIHIFSVGEKHEDKPALVLISGLATPSPIADFYPIWSRFMDEYQVVVIERAGYGWSDDTKRERTIENLAAEDKLALEAAGISEPYILVAHSLGGLEANKFSADYPDLVSGVVLLDCTSPELMLTESSSFSFMTDILYPVARNLGIFRLINAFSPETLQNQSWSSRNNFEDIPDEYKQIDLMFTLNKYQNKMVREERKMRLDNAKTMLDTHFPSKIPVTLIFAYQQGYEEYPEYAEYMNMQKKWVENSDYGEVINVTGRHYIHHYATNEVCDIIEDVIDLANQN